MPVVERMRPLLGTFATIRAESGGDMTPMQVEAAVESAFRAVARVDRLMSFHRAASDVGRLNRCRPGSRVRIHGWTYTVLRTALELGRASDGAFDCNVGSPLMRAGLLPRTVGRVTGRFRARHRPLHHALTLHANRTAVPRSPLALDLGGIAKGFAVDKAVHILQTCGVTAGIVNAGGDLRVFGGKAEPIWLRDPRAPGEARLAGAITDGAIATSAAYFTGGLRAGRSASAIVDTASGHRVDIAGSVSVIARSCMLADALTKVVVCRGRLPTSLARKAAATALVQ